MGRHNLCNKCAVRLKKKASALLSGVPRLKWVRPQKVKLPHPLTPFCFGGGSSQETVKTGPSCSFFLLTLMGRSQHLCRPTETDLPEAKDFVERFESGDAVNRSQERNRPPENDPKSAGGLRRANRVDRGGAEYFRDENSLRSSFSGSPSAPILHNHEIDEPTALRSNRLNEPLDIGVQVEGSNRKLPSIHFLRLQISSNRTSCLQRAGREWP